MKRGVRVLVLAAAVVAAAAVFAARQPDQGAIAARIAARFASGEGFGYNPGGYIPLTGAGPLYVLALGLAASLAGVAAIPVAALVINALAIFAAGMALSSFDEDEGRIAGFAAGLTLATLPSLHLLAGTDAAPWVALVLWGIAAHRKDRRALSASFWVAAALIRPITLLPLLLVAGKDLFRQRTHWLPAGVALIHGLVALITAGAPAFPPDLAALLAGARSLAEDMPTASWLALLPLPLAAWGLLSLKRFKGGGMVVAWGALHGGLGFLLGFAPGVGAFIPLAAAFSAMVGAAAFQLNGKGRPANIIPILSVMVNTAIAAASLLLPGWLAGWEPLAPAPIAETDRLAGGWLRDNAAPGSALGTTRIGALAAESGLVIIDLRGRLDRDLGAAARRADDTWALHETLPDWLALDADELADMAGDPYIQSMYTAVGVIEPAAPREDAISLFQRTGAPAPVAETLISFVDYPGPVVLNGLASDFSLYPLATGVTGTLRLEWLLEGPGAADAFVSVRLTDTDGAVLAQSDRQLAFSRWPARQFITSYHPLSVLPGLGPGAYPISVGVGPSADTLTWERVAVAKIPFAADTSLGALSGLTATFGPVRAEGYRLSRDERGVALMILWRAVSAPVQDYTVAVRIVDAAGSVAAELLTQPYGGRYPTSIWSPGEGVNETYILPLDGVPPGTYQLMLALLGDDGVPVPLADGAPAALVGEFQVEG